MLNPQPDSFKAVIRVYARKKQAISLLLSSGHEIFGTVVETPGDYFVVQAKNNEIAYVKDDEVCAVRALSS